MIIFVIISVDNDIFQIHNDKDIKFFGKILLIYPWKLARAFVNPKNIT